MKTADEMKLLRGVLKYTDQTAKPMPRWKRELVLWSIVLMLLVVVSAIYLEPTILAAVIAICSFLSGFVFCSFAYHQDAAIKWPVLARFIDKPQLQARLDELDA